MIANDILLIVYGSSKTEEEASLDHNEKLIKLMHRVQQNGIKLNRHKTKLHLHEFNCMDLIHVCDQTRLCEDSEHTGDAEP